MDTFYAIVVGVMIILAPFLILGALLLSLVVIIGPAILRALLPAPNARIKWFLVFVLAALQIFWFCLRGGTFWNSLLQLSFHADLSDWLLVSAWMVFLVSLITLRATPLHRTNR